MSKLFLTNIVLFLSFLNINSYCIPSSMYFNNVVRKNIYRNINTFTYNLCMNNNINDYTNFLELNNNLNKFKDFGNYLAINYNSNKTNNKKNIIYLNVQSYIEYQKILTVIQKLDKDKLIIVINNNYTNNNDYKYLYKNIINNISDIIQPLDDKK